MISYYKSRIQFAEKEIARNSKKANLYSVLRLVVLVAGFIIIYQSLQFEKIWLTELIFLALIILFAWLVSRQSKHENDRQFHADLKKINQNEIDSIESGQNIYSDGTPFIDSEHIYTSDLDIFGENSLFQLANRCSTKQGNLMLSSWVSAPAGRDQICGRQKAVEELASKSEWRQNFQTILLFSNNITEDPIKKILLYLKNDPVKIPNLLKLYIGWIPFLFLGTAALSFFVPKVFILLIILAIANLFIIQSHESKIERTELLLTKAGKLLSKFSYSFKMIENESWQSGLTRELTGELTNNKTDFFKGIKALSVLISRLELRSGILIGFVLNVSSVWVLRQYLEIEKWKELNSSNLEKAFNVLATFESLTSLASLKANHPEWTFPSISNADNYTLSAIGIGHPLIESDIRVLNDFHLRDEFKIDIITGSNMAGKSTFLRTIGINAVLALCGAPVCARQMEITPILIFSYMRIRDSLNENTSTFKAELNRLQLLLNKLKEDQKIYFLIDEMLRGTNSVDKYRGSKAIIEQLISKKAVGIVATHDLQIAHLEKEYPDYIRNFHFDIEIINEEMHFDYKIREGECKTFNASILLKKLGISIND
ncbi:MutS-related protein [Daejeonella oryzae]|uniref:MutS-related protein n=1 Tax=Daejeonella oryzae TaxID=1122943 RepID=UPI000415C989|nr:hypothetical protein [Daejeonella oryzae]